jgi:hypothetical protein
VFLGSVGAVLPPGADGVTLGNMYPELWIEFVHLGSKIGVPSVWVVFKIGT